MMTRLKYSMVLIILCAQSVIAQVGVGTTNPNATLDIRSSDQVAPANNDGLLIPKVDEFPATNPTATQDGMLVFVTGNGTPSKGFYYWDEGQTSWISATGAKRINDLIDGKSDIDGTDDGSSIFFGIGAGVNDDGTNNGNIGIGFDALNAVTSGQVNLAVGYLSLSLNTNGEGNTAVGAGSMYYNTSGYFNTAIGLESLFNNATGNYNIANGFRALYNNTSGFFNTANGVQALWNNTTGSYNSANGGGALSNNTEGEYNTASGILALGFNTAGNQNVGIGYGALLRNSLGNNNVALGTLSGQSSQGDNNVFLGFESAGKVATDSKSGSVFIGYQSGYNEAVSNRLYIENSNADANNALIYGEFDNDILRTNSEFQVNKEGISGTQTIVAGLISNTSNRPILLFSETGSIGLTEGMSLEYNGVGLAGENRMIFNGLGGNPLFEFRNDGNLIALNGRIGVQTAAPTCAVEINHPIGIANEGLKLTNQVDTDAWRFYVQWNTNLLSLLYNNVNVGNFDSVSGVYTAVSDRNLKTNISNLSSVLEKIQTLQVVDYNFKLQNDSKKYVGLIAQDVEIVFPHLVVAPNEESENYTMDYSGFGVLAIKAIQEQQDEIETLKTQLQEQNIEITKIKEMLKQLLEKE